MAAVPAQRVVAEQRARVARLEATITASRGQRVDALAVRNVDAERARARVERVDQRAPAADDVARRRAAALSSGRTVRSQTNAAESSPGSWWKV